MDTTQVQIPNFSASIAPAPQDAIMQGLQRKAQLQIEFNQKQQQQNIDSVIQGTQSVANAISASVAASKARQKKDFINTLSDSLANRPQPNTNPALVNMGGVSQQVPTAAYNPSASDAMRAAIRLNPEAASADYLKTLSVDPQTQLLNAQTKTYTLQNKILDAQRKQAEGGEVPDTVKTMLASGGMQVPEGMTMAQLKTTLPGMNAGMRAGVLGEMARARGDQVTANLSDKMATDINPAKWTPGSPGGVAAQRVLAAKDAKALFDQIRAQPEGPTRRQAVEGAIATMKTLMGSGNGVVSEKLVNEMIPQTARGKYANWEEFLTNTPQGNDQQQFMDQFEHQIDRVNQINSSIVDDRIRQAISTHKVLHQRDPQAWEANMEAAGLDPADVKNNVYKPQTINRLRNTALGRATTQSNNGPSIDQDALTAELKRRGLQ